MIQTLKCQNGAHFYDRVASRGRQPTSCVDHGGTGITVKSYRSGSKAGEQAFAKTGGAVKVRLGSAYAITPEKVSEKEARNAAAIARAIKAAKGVLEARNGTDMVRAIKAAGPRNVGARIAAGSQEGAVKLQTLHCAFDGHEWTRPTKRGTPPKFCPEHATDLGAKIDKAVATDKAVAERQQAEWSTEEYPVDIELNGRGGYKPETTVNEQRTLLWGKFGGVDGRPAPVKPAESFAKPEQPKRRQRAGAAALQAPTVTEDHTGEFWCEDGEHWSPRKSMRGRAPRICDEHKASPEHERAVRQSTLDAAETRGERVAEALISRLRANGTDLQSNSDRFQLQRWSGKRWENGPVTADNWGVKHWMQDDDNAHSVKIRRYRWQKITSL